MENINQQKTERENFLEHLDAAPEPVREAAFSVETADKILAIGQNHNLNIDQIGRLADEVGRIMVGMEPREAFIGNLADNLGVSVDLGRVLAASVEEQIFAPIRGSLVAYTEKPRPVEPTIAKTENIAAPAESIFAKKLGEPFRLPREEVDLEIKNDPYLEPTSQ